MGADNDGNFNRKLHSPRLTPERGAEDVGVEALLVLAYLGRVAQRLRRHRRRDVDVDLRAAPRLFGHRRY